MFFTDEDEISFVDKIVKVASALNNCNFSILQMQVSVILMGTL